MVRSYKIIVHSKNLIVFRVTTQKLEAFIMINRGFSKGRHLLYFSLSLRVAAYPDRVTSVANCDTQKVAEIGSKVAENRKK